MRGIACSPGPTTLGDMAITKDSITQILRPMLPPEGFQWAAVHEGSIGLKLYLPAARSTDALESTAAACLSAIARGHPQDKIGPVIVEFVDNTGKVVHTARPEAQGNPPAGMQAGGMDSGHRPIGGLRETKASTPQESATGLPGVSRIIAVGAGKGGVGKSTVSVNLAVGLAQRGHAVGILDADIYGPSLPTMLGLGGMEQVVHSGQLQPFYVHGVKAITIGKLVDPEKPLIWRGPMAHGAFTQLTDQTDWGTLDYLVIDLPPGTGDVSLSMAQKLRLTGAVVVCTPQKVAQDDAVRALRMFQQLGVPVLGVVENMSYFVGDDGKEYDLFGRGGAEVMSQRYNVPFLGNIPITMKLRENSDEGTPARNFEGGTALARSLEALVSNVENQAALAALKTGQSRPTLNIR